MSFSALLADYFNAISRQIQLGLICKVEKFDKKTMRADVQPLMKVKNDLDEETKYPILSDLPVVYISAGGFYIRPMYERGDLVWVSFSTFDIANGLDEYTRAESSKIFSLENACVMGGIASNKFTPPTEFNSEDGLIVGEKNGNSYMVFADDSITMKFGKGAQEIKFSSSGIDCDAEVTANKKILPIALSTHKHNFTGMGSVSTPIP